MKANFIKIKSLQNFFQHFFSITASWELQEAEQCGNWGALHIQEGTKSLLILLLKGDAGQEWGPLWASPKFLNRFLIKALQWTEVGIHCSPTGSLNWKTFPTLRMTPLPCLVWESTELIHQQLCCYPQIPSRARPEKGACKEGHRELLILPQLCSYNHL